MKEFIRNKTVLRKMYFYKLFFVVLLILPTTFQGRAAVIFQSSESQIELLLQEADDLK